MELDLHRKQRKGVEGKEMEHIRFLLGQCLFSWLVNAFFPHLLT